MLNEKGGHVLLTTGSKELSAYTGVKDFQERLYPRVLPTAQSIGACLNCGFPPNHIIAMHGPFSAELTAAIMRQFWISTSSQRTAARVASRKIGGGGNVGADVIVIARPADEGLTLDGS